MEDLKVVPIRIAVTEPAWRAMGKLKETGLFGLEIADVAERLICRALIEELRPNGLLAPIWARG